MKNPSKSQIEAFSHGDGPALLIAGPGSGKTFTIIKRIEYLISSLKVSSEEILVLTFSKAAAGELYNRYRAIIPNGNTEFHTFHSLAYQILSNRHLKNKFKLITDSQKHKILSFIIKNHNLADQISSDDISEIINIISKSKNMDAYNNMTLFSEQNSALFRVNKYVLNMILSDYSEFLKEKGMLDYDDLIIEAIDLLKSRSDCLKSYKNIYKHIIIDEFQDINAPQYDLIKLLYDGSLFVVGDDDQAIYGFRGSTPSIMKQFVSDFYGVKTYYLLDNYRSKKKIVEFSSNIIKANKNRYEKQLNAINIGGEISINICLSRIEEEQALVDILKNFCISDLNNTAIILRTNREVKLYTNLLNNNNIPVKDYKSKAINFSETEYFKDVIAYLKFLYEKPKREFFIRFMNKPERFIQRAALVSDVVSLEQLQAYYLNNSDMLDNLYNMFKNIETAKKIAPYMAISLFRRALGYDKYLYENHIDNQKEIIQNLNEMEQIFKKYDTSVNIDAFIKLNYDTGNKVSYEKESKSGVKLLTMHASKGLEFDNVILPDINEGVIPPKNCIGNELEEERRLLYVAVTRAKNRLNILTANERNRNVSRFINKLIDDI